MTVLGFHRAGTHDKLLVATCHRGNPTDAMGLFPNTVIQYPAISKRRYGLTFWNRNLHFSFKNCYIADEVEVQKWSKGITI